MKQTLHLTNTSDSGVNHSLRGRVIVIQMLQLLEVKKGDQEHFSGYISLIDQFDKLAQQLNLCQQDILNLQHLGPQKYNDDIYRLIRYTKVESWSQTDLNNIYSSIGGDEKLPYYGLVPRVCVVLADMANPLQGLDKLGSQTLFTPKTQLMVNYCIQIILDIVYYCKTSAYKAHEYKQYYIFSNNKICKMGGSEDYLCDLCQQLYIIISVWATTNGINIFSQIEEIFDISKLQQEGLDPQAPGKLITKHLSWEQAHLYYLKEYPGLQQQFSNCFEYLSPFNTDVWVFILFANVPNTAKYQQLLKIRTALKRVYDLINSYPVNLQSNIKQQCYRWCKLNTPRFSSYYQKYLHTGTHNSKKNNNNYIDMEVIWEQDPMFRKLCIIYMEVFEHPFMLLEQLYHEARNQRAQQTQGEKYPDINMYEHGHKLV